MKNEKGNATKAWQWRVKSPVGDFFLVASEQGLRGLYWERRSDPMLKNLEGTGRASAILRQALAELDEYFAGKRKKFTVPLEFAGTAFQERVWAELRKIPYGQTISYTELAKRVERETAVRAVGTANGRNHLSIFIPCHRVIARDGTLGGYAGGLGVKSKLLAIEGRED